MSQRPPHRSVSSITLPGGFLCNQVCGRPCRAISKSFVVQVLGIALRGMPSAGVVAVEMAGAEHG